MVKRFLILDFGLWIALFYLSVVPPLLAQQPQAQSGQPIYAVNAKYVQGVGPGYWPTAGSGLVLNLSAGSTFCGSPPTLVTYAGGTLTLTASQTNFVYLNPAAACAPAFNISGFVAGQVPIAKVVTGLSAITGITDARNWFVPQPVVTDSAGGAIASLKNLNSIRLVDQFAGATVPLQIAAAITDVGTTAEGVVVAAPVLGQGLPTTVPNNVLFLNLRGYPNTSLVGGVPTTFNPAQIQFSTGLPPQDLTNNANILLNGRLYLKDPGAVSQVGNYFQTTVEGNHNNGAGVFGADIATFNAGQALNLSNTANFAEMDGSESEASFGGSATTIPNYRMVGQGAQTYVLDRTTTDTAVVPNAFDMWARGPFRNSSCAARVGTVTVTNGSTAVTGVGTDFAAGDVGKKLFVTPAGLTNLNDAYGGPTIASVTSATVATLTSAWLNLTIGGAGGKWQTTAATATGPCGGTSSIQAGVGLLVTKTNIPTSSASAITLDQDGGHSEIPLDITWNLQGVSKWRLNTNNNALTQSSDISLDNFVAGPSAFRFTTPVAGNGDAYINSVGTGAVRINAIPAFSGEGVPSSLGSGGLVISTGGASPGAPVAAAGIIRVPNNTTVAARNAANTADISMVGTNVTNQVVIDAGALGTVIGGKVAQYNTDTLVANGVPSEVGASDLTAQTASILSTALKTPPADGMFRVAWYLETTLAGTAGTATISITWTDDAQAETFTSTTLNLAALGQLSGEQILWARTVAAIAYSTTVAGALGAPQYAVHVKVERM